MWRRSLAELESTANCEWCSGRRSSCDGPLCLFCLKLFASQRWTGCCRCGRLACGGACIELPIFASVQALFSYCGHHRELLLRAKDIQDPQAIFCFNAVYSKLVDRALRQTIERENIGVVVLPRLGLRRLVNLHWHPADFWKQSLQRISAEKNLQIIMRPPHFGPRRALLSSARRRLDVTRRAQVDSQTAKSVSLPAMQLPAILFVDDVLTSGGTLIREWEDCVGCSSPLFTRLSGVDVKGPDGLPTRINAHILTLFRTPVSELSKGNPSELVNPN